MWHEQEPSRRSASAHQSKPVAMWCVQQADGTVVPMMAVSGTIEDLQYPSHDLPLRGSHNHHSPTRTDSPKPTIKTGQAWSSQGSGSRTRAPTRDATSLDPASSAMMIQKVSSNRAAWNSNDINDNRFRLPKVKANTAGHNLTMPAPVMSLQKAHIEGLTDGETSSTEVSRSKFLFREALSNLCQDSQCSKSYEIQRKLNRHGLKADNLACATSLRN